MNTKWAMSGWIVAGIVTVGAGVLLLRSGSSASPDSGESAAPHVVARVVSSAAPSGSSGATPSSAAGSAAPTTEAVSSSKGTLGAAPSNTMPSSTIPSSATQAPSRELHSLPKDGSALILKRLVLARDIQQREPLPLENARTDEPIVAFVELANSAADESGIVVTFEHETGAKVGFVSLAVPAESPRYRTWARTRNVKSPGTWTAIVSTPDGRELGRETFVVTEG